MRLLLPLLALCAALGAAPHTNVVLILMDDMGWRDPAFAGGKVAETPNLDRFVKQGAVLRNCYSSAPNCAPTRACLLTGQYTPRHGVFTVVDERYDPGQAHHRILSVKSSDEVPKDTVMLAEALKARGYATSLVGMWNLGRGRKGSPGNPQSRGFDQYLKPEDLGFEKDAYQDAKGRFLSDAFADEAVKFIEANKSKPFFLYYADHATHEPFDPPKALVEKYSRKASAGKSAGLAATVEAADAAIGRVLDALDRLGLAKDTLVVFTSDNGGMPGEVSPLRGSKGLLYEGGIRVPGAVRWPGVIKPGLAIDEPVLSMDFYPTILAATGTPLPKGQPVDGVDLGSVLRTGTPTGRKAIFWHFPCFIGKGEPMSMARAGDFKLIHKFDGPVFELYDLKADPSESKDLSKSQPQKLAEMKKLLADWQTAVKAPLADKPNPAYDPKAEAPRGGGGGGGGGKGGKGKKGK
ncbi:MAG: hypothetical protein RL105_451 [Verrucomicrobiota bacterium]